MCVCSRYLLHRIATLCWLKGNREVEATILGGPWFESYPVEEPLQEIQLLANENTRETKSHKGRNCAVWPDCVVVAARPPPLGKQKVLHFEAMLHGAFLEAEGTYPQAWFNHHTLQSHLVQRVNGILTCMIHSKKRNKKAETFFESPAPLPTCLYNTPVEGFSIRDRACTIILAQNYFES